MNTAPRWSRGWIVAAAALALGLASCTKSADTVCYPPDAFGARTAAAKGPIRVYWDGSLSMAGYIDGSTATLRPLGDVQTLLKDLATREGVKEDWRKFGARIAPVADPDVLGTRAAFTCVAGQPCDNSQSRIDTVLNTIAAGDKNGLSVVVTDLWLDDSSFSGSPQVALGEPLKALLRQGRSIGLVGIRAPYTGPIYDLPSKAKYMGAEERPVFVLLIGDRAQVLAAYQALAQSGSPGLGPDRLKFSLFTQQPAQAWMGSSAGVQATGAGATPSAFMSAQASGGLPQFRFKPSEAKNGGVIHARVDGAPRILSGAVWSGPLHAATRVWLLKDHGACSPDAYSAFPPLAGAWHAIPGSASAADFAFDVKSAAGLTPGRDYLVVATLGSQALTVPNPADAWIKDWGFSPDQEKTYVAGNPKFFKTLNLGDVGSLMESALRETTPPQGRDLATFAFVVRVER